MLKSAFFLLLLALPALSLAADPSAPRWYRYYDDRHQPNISDSVTPEHVTHGYDELTANMQLIRHVEAQHPLSPQEIAAAKAKREAEAQRARDDKQLLRLYASPADAEHARDRQIDAIQLRVDFSTNSLASLRQRRAAEAQKAAVFERTGKPVPKDIKDNVASYDKQIIAAQNEINQRKAEQDKVRSDFAPVIQRLQELTGKPAAETAPPAAPAPAASH